MKPNPTIIRAVFAIAATFIFSHCAKQSQATRSDGKAAIAQGPGAGRVRNAEREVPGLAPIVQAPGRNDEAMLRPAR